MQTFDRDKLENCLHPAVRRIEPSDWLRNRRTTTPQDRSKMPPSPMSPNVRVVETDVTIVDFIQNLMILSKVASAAGETSLDRGSAVPVWQRRSIDRSRKSPLTYL